MVSPLDAFVAFHNAFRNDIELTDRAVYEAARERRPPGRRCTVPVLQRGLEWHAQGEELAAFPAIEKITPQAAGAYEQDHQGLNALFASLKPPQPRRPPGRAPPTPGGRSF